MRFLFVAAILSLLASGCQRSDGNAKAGPAPIARPGDSSAAPDSAKAAEPAPADNAAADNAATGNAAADNAVTVQQLDFAGIEKLVASHRGQVVVMDAWSLSCPPCIREFSKLVDLQKRYPPQQLACISLSFDYDGIGQPADKLPRVETFLRKQQATFDNVLATDESDVLYRKFHLLSVPAVFVYDKTGKLRHRFDNQQANSEADTFTYEDVERLVVELLAETPADSPDAATGAAEKTAGPAD